MEVIKRGKERCAKILIKKLSIPDLNMMNSDNDTALSIALKYIQSNEKIVKRQLINCPIDCKKDNKLHLGTITDYIPNYYNGDRIAIKYDNGTDELAGINRYTDEVNNLECTIYKNTFIIDLIEKIHKDNSIPTQVFYEIANIARKPDLTKFYRDYLSQLHLGRGKKRY